MGSVAVEPVTSPPGFDIHTTLAYKLDPALEKDGQRDFTAGTVAQYRHKHNHVPVQIHDMRTAEEPFTLDQQGFQVVTHESVEKLFEDNERIKSVYYKETEELIRKASGATRVHAFSHLVRRNPPEVAQKLADDPSIDGYKQVGVTVPSNGVHIDQSDRGSSTVLDDNMPADEVSKLRTTRWAIMNLWRPIKTVHRDPLTVCDARTVSDEDLIPRVVRLPAKGTGTYDGVSGGKSFELLEVWPKPQHSWYYTSLMRPDEALVLKIFDTKKADGCARRTPHTSFSIPGAENEEPRESIEVRCLVFWEDEKV